MTRLHCTWLAVILFTGCATVAPQQPVADLKSIAGAWRGSNNTGSPVDLIVYDDGHFDASVTTPQQILRRNGQIRPEGQQFVYDADSSSGRLTYVGSEENRRLIMWGTLKEGGQKFVIEYMPSNR
jgi:hypothetical protein